MTRACLNNHINVVAITQARNRIRIERNTLFTLGTFQRYGQFQCHAERPLTAIFSLMRTGLIYTTKGIGYTMWRNTTTTSAVALA